MSSRSAREDNQLLLNVIVPIGVLGALAGIVIASQHLNPDNNIPANRPEAIRFSPPLLLQPPLYPIIDSPACGRGLTYQRNSCYIDSVLVALFTIPNQVVIQKILEQDLNKLAHSNIKLFTECIQNGKANRIQDVMGRKPVQAALKEIAEYIQGGSKSAQTCVNLRGALRHCTKAPEMFSGHGTQDAGEFLTYIFNLFQVDVATHIVQVYAAPWEGGPWQETVELINRNESPIIDIDVNALVKNTPLSVYTHSITITPVTDWAQGKWKKNVNTYLSPYLVFRVYRLFADGQINQTPLVPEETIRLIDDSILYLTAIVIHTGAAHYVCVVRCGNIWYYYDDLAASGQFQFLGKYKNMLNMKKYNPKSLGVLYFYTQTSNV